MSLISIITPDCHLVVGDKDCRSYLDCLRKACIKPPAGNRSYHLVVSVSVLSVLPFKSDCCADLALDDSCIASSSSLTFLAVYTLSGSCDCILQSSYASFSSAFHCVLRCSFIVYKTVAISVLILRSISTTGLPDFLNLVKYFLFLCSGWHHDQAIHFFCSTILAASSSRFTSISQIIVAYP